MRARSVTSGRLRCLGRSPAGRDEAQDPLLAARRTRCMTGLSSATNSRAAIVSDLDRNLLVGPEPVPARRLVGDGWRPGSRPAEVQIEHMAAVTFTRIGGVGTPRPFPAGAGGRAACRRSPRRSGRTASVPHCRISSASSPAPSIPFCAHLLRERPVGPDWRRGSPSSTGNGAFRRSAVRRRGGTSSPMPGRPAIRCFRNCADAGLKTGQLHSAFETVCDLEDVEFPTGDAQRGRQERLAKGRRRFWTDLGKLLPTSIDPKKTTCKVQERAVRFPPRVRHFPARRERTATLVQLLSIWAPKPEVVLKRWRPTMRRCAPALARGLHEERSATTSSPVHGLISASISIASS